MVSCSLVALGVATVLGFTTPSAFVEAHQRVEFPTVVYTVADRYTNWGPQAKLEKQGYKTTKDFNAYLKANKYETLRAFMDKEGAYKPNKGATVECGYTDPNAPAQPIPTNGNFKTSGYTHEGPCEIWIDDVRVKHGDNCHYDIANTSFVDTIDYSSCQGSCMLKWYWLGIRPMGKRYSWQIYKACIPLADKSGGGSHTKTTTAPASDDGEIGNDSDADNIPATTPATTPAPSAEEPEVGGEAKTPVKCARRRD